MLSRDTITQFLSFSANSLAKVLLPEASYGTPCSTSIFCLQGVLFILFLFIFYLIYLICGSQ